MNKNTGHSVVRGNIEALDQGIKLVQKLTDEQYIYIAQPYVTSSIGQHFRHIADVFFAVISTGNQINYDTRRRGAEIERSRIKAIEEFSQVKSYIAEYMNDSTLALDNVEKLVKTEVTIEETESVSFSSSLLRELIFASSHAVHHFALISVIAKLQGVSLSGNFGVAPATATFLRQDSKVPTSDTPECAL